MGVFPTAVAAELKKKQHEKKNIFFVVVCNFRFILRLTEVTEYRDTCMRDPLAEEYL